MGQRWYGPGSYRRPELLNQALKRFGQAVALWQIVQQALSSHMERLMMPVRKLALPFNR